MEINTLQDTIFLSVKIGLFATFLNLPLALTLSYLLDRVLKKNKSVIEGIINLPLVMPPVTTGFLLLFLLGKRGVLGALLYKNFGITIAYTQFAAVLASMIVSFPLIIRSIRISMEMIDSRLEKAAMTLGANRLAVYIRITIPLIFPGLINGMVLGFARGLGEFGATITFAGNIEGVTRTIPLSVYSLLQIPGKEQEAAILVLLSIAISFIAMFFSSLLNENLKKKRSEHHES